MPGPQSPLADPVLQRHASQCLNSVSGQRLVYAFILMPIYISGGRYGRPNRCADNAALIRQSNRRVASEMISSALTTAYTVFCRIRNRDRRVPT